MNFKQIFNCLKEFNLTFFKISESTMKQKNNKIVDIMP